MSHLTQLQEDYARMSMELNNAVNEQYIENLQRHMSNNQDKQEQEQA